MRQTLMRLIGWLTTTSSLPTVPFISSYQTSTSTRRLSARPASVALLAIGRVSPAHSYEIDFGGSASAFWKYSATSPARSSAMVRF